MAAASKWIAGEKLEHEASISRRSGAALARPGNVKPLLRYRCAACGFEATPALLALPRLPGVGQLSCPAY